MIPRKKKICKKCGELKYIVSTGFCAYCKKGETMKEELNKPPIKKRARSATKKRPRKPKSSNKQKKRGTKSKSLSFLKSKVWRMFSKFIRLRDSNEDGYCTCITCDRPLFWKQTQAGHFIPQHNNPNTIFHEENVHAQCPQCNIYLHGNQYLYSLKVDLIYGSGTAEKILCLSKQEKRFTIEEYELMLKDYTNRVKSLLQEKGLPD